MRAWFLCLLLALVGCTTAGKKEIASDPGLDTDELTFAKALAHYGQGLLTEGTQGVTSENSIKEFSKAADLDPGRHRIHSRLAVIALMKGDTDAAIRELERSTQENPESLEAWLDLARTFQLSGRIEDAIQHYRRALRLAPDNDHIRAAIAGLLFEQNKDRQALTLIEEALDEAGAESPLAAFCHKQGRDFIVAKQPERAIRCFQVLRRRLPPDTHQYDYLLGEIYRTTDRIPEAIQAYHRATQHTSPLPDAFIKQALLEVSSNPEQAIRTLKDGTRRLPDSPVLALTLASLYVQLQRHDEAIPFYQRVYTTAAESETTDLKANFYLNYGAALERAGRHANAAEIFEEGLAKHPDTPQILNYLAYMWAEQGINLEQAEAHAVKALEMEPENGAYLDTLAWVYYKQGNHAAAREQIARAQQHMADDPTVHEHAGDIHMAIGDRKEAIAQWKKGFRLDPENQALADRLAAQGIDLRQLREPSDAADR